MASEPKGKGDETQGVVGAPDGEVELRAAPALGQPGRHRGQQERGDVAQHDDERDVGGPLGLLIDEEAAGEADHAATQRRGEEAGEIGAPDAGVAVDSVGSLLDVHDR